MTDMPSRPRQAPGVVSSEVLDELVAYCPGASQAVSLNASARAIWELCDGTRTVDDICSELSEPARMPAQALRGDVQAAIDQFRQLGLLASDSP